MLTTRERLVAAARDVVRAEGSAAVSVRRAAAAAGVTPMALYRHFESRQALLDAVADATFDELAGAWGEVSWQGNPDEGLGAAVQAYLDFALAEPRLYALLFLEVRPGARQYPQGLAGEATPTLRILTVGLRRGMDAGHLRREDPLEWSLVLAALLQGLVHMYHCERIGLTEPEFRALCERAVTRTLAGLRAA